MSCSKVWAHSRQQPTDATNEALIGVLAMDLSRGVVGVKRWRDGINWDAGTIWSCRRGLVAGLMDKTLTEVCGKARLVEMDGNQSWGDAPQKMNAKKPFNNPHKVHLATLSKKMAEKGFNRGILQEINKVFDIHFKGQWR